MKGKKERRRRNELLNHRARATKLFDRGIVINTDVVTRLRSCLTDMRVPLPLHP